MIRVGAIIDQHIKQDAIVLVVSALGKTTNRLERLVAAAASQSPDFDAEWVELQHTHWVFIDELGIHEPAQLPMLFKELRDVLEGIRLLGDAPARVFDRVMSYGELLSSTLLAAYLQNKGYPIAWVDAREVIHTDLNYRAARVIWPQTQHAIRERITPLLQQGLLPLTQGFIASGSDGSTTTLGREGSDYSAALIAAALHAQRVVVWKDVPGVLSADPRFLSHYQQLGSLSYRQAVEMTYYGASVIHPNTLRPLFEADIPLQVRSFVDPNADGTRIDAHQSSPLPSFQLTFGVSVLSIQPDNLSFVDEEQFRHVFDLASQIGLRSLLIARSAVSLFLCCDGRPHLIHEFLSLLKQQYRIEHKPGLILIAEQNSPLAFSVHPEHLILEQRLSQSRFLVVNELGLSEWKTAYEEHYVAA